MSTDTDTPAVTDIPSDTPTVTPRLEIGDTCQVLWRDGSQKLLAEIIETRVKKKRKNKQDDDHDDSSDDQIEYYIHYIHHDRRLDEWVDRNQFLLETLVKAPTVEEQDGDGDGRTTRGQRKRADTTALLSRASPTAVSLDPTLAALEQEHEETTKVKNISKIYMAGWEVEAWYFSPYPDEYAQVDTLYVCEYCLKYMRYAHTFSTHRSLCECRRPPGREIYRHEDISVMEVNGRDARVYCQNLCLLAKLFLDHKTLYYDVDPFMFYIICQVDEFGAHIVGYFSKEKVSDYNLACILCFPQYQKSGYGKFIISLSYELTKREGKTGSPEKPLSDLGKMAYRSYWTHVLVHLLANHENAVSELSMKKMAELTGIKVEDIISTLQSLDMIKCWKGQHVVHVKRQDLLNYLKQDKQFRLCKSEYLKWEPNERA